MPKKKEREVKSNTMFAFLFRMTVNTYCSGRLARLASLLNVDKTKIYAWNKLLKTGTMAYTPVDALLRLYAKK